MEGLVDSLGGCAGHGVLEDLDNVLAALPDGRDDAGGGRQQTPHDGDDDPHGEVALVEHTGGEGQQRPQHDQHQGQGAARHPGPAQSLGQSLGGVITLSSKGCGIILNCRVGNAMMEERDGVGF